MPRWPHDDPASLAAFYGTPGPEVERQLVKVVPPFEMYYQTRPVKFLLFHRKAAGALAAALNDIWEASGRSQAKLDHDGASSTAGTYNCRKIAGSDRWSNHAYGAAIDLDAEHNGFYAGKGTIPQYVIDAFDRIGFRWGGRYTGRRTDPMHFEACDDGTPHPVTFVDMPVVDAAFDPWAGEYHVKGVCFADVEGEPEDEHSERERDSPMPPAKPSAGGFFGRLRNWLTAGASSVGLTGLGALTNGEVVALLLGFIALSVVGCFLVALWLWGKQNVADWIAKHIA